MPEEDKYNEDETNYQVQLEEKLDKDEYDIQQGYGSPESEKKETFLSFLKGIISLDDSTKVSNLANEELASVRIAKKIAQFALVFKWDKVAEYMNEQAEITLSTAMSKKGWFMDKSITQVRKVERTTGSIHPTPQKKGFFSSRGEQ